MDIHNNAVLTPRGRAIMVAHVVTQGWSYRATARHYQVDPQTVRRWVVRFRSAGQAGLCDRSSRPYRQPRRTPQRLSRQVTALRRQRWSMQRIADGLGLSRATVGRTLQRAGLNRLSALEPVEPPRRYQHEHPGDLLHLDIKKLARFNHPGHRITGVRAKDSVGVGWEFVHVAIDDRSRIAFTEIHPTEGKAAAIAHLQTAVRYYASLGITIRRLLTDNGPCYRSRAFARACNTLGIRHRFTRPYTPRTNGKAERFIQTALREWAYAFSYRNSQERAHHPPRWQHDYNWHRQHGSLNNKPPISVLGLSGDNLLRLH
ncbi:MAG: IS481 family transposase, partial [Aquisalimonadaceae bacterium]